MRLATVETVAGEGDQGNHPSLCLDENGDPRICFVGRDDSSLDLYFAARNAGEWSVEAVGPATGDPLRNSMALDRLGHPHIVYDALNSPLSYLWRDEVGWQTECIVEGGNNESCPKIALGPEGHVHVVFTAGFSDHDAMYAVRTDSGWHVEAIMSGGSRVVCPHLHTDGAGWPHVAVLDNATPEAFHAFRSNSGWRIETIDLQDVTPYEFSMALDPVGRCHIALADVGGLNVKYLLRDGDFMLEAQGNVEAGQLHLSWLPAVGSETWVYGAADDCWFNPGFAPGFAHRLAIVPAGTVTWQTTHGVGDPGENWTFLVLAVDSDSLEMGRSNRIGDWDFWTDTPTP